MTRLRKPPVCFTLAQMRFNPVLDLGPHVPALQEAFRKAGYPDYEPNSQQSVEIHDGRNGGLEFKHRETVRHVFRNKDRTAAMILDSSALSYEVTDYHDFEQFTDAFLEALGIVHHQRSIEYWDRLGMRMLDAIQPATGESLEDYVVPQVLGLIELVADVEYQRSQSESLFTMSDDRSLLVRTIRTPDGIAAPHDLLPLRLEIASRFERSGETLMLDTDSFETKRCDYSPERVRKHLAELKQPITVAFKTVVTPHALETWA